MFVRLALLDVCLESLDACLKVLDVCLESLDACLEVLDVCLESLDACLKVLDACLEVLDACLKVLDAREGRKLRPQIKEVVRAGARGENFSHLVEAL